MTKTNKLQIVVAIADIGNMFLFFQVLRWFTFDSISVFLDHHCSLILYMEERMA
jgi:hypothetical protein